MTAGKAAPRALPTIIDIRHSRFERSIHDQVIDGLTKEPKTLPALLFYSTEGLRHWNNHSHQPDFYPRSEEVQILKQKAQEMASTIADHSVVVDMGSASLDKVIHLLRALEAQKKTINYYALDLSATELTSTLQAIPTEEFHHTPIICDQPHHMLLFGLTIGNYSRPNAAAFLSQIAENALIGRASQLSSILITVDRCKLPTKVLRAYTSDGVVPFALEALNYGNQLLGEQKDERTPFDPNDWYFHSEWNYVLSRHEASLIPRYSDIKLGPPLDGVVVKREEKIRFGCSYKYDAKEMEDLISAAGLRTTGAWEGDGCDVAFYELKLEEST
ncbi:uncharacterized protein F4812DRAFT_451784 [Daldinia caldariorum]|uniref:uncharacterized protein n=1 Tax=Daldinia caldariorum TaxID=326644 RepID=UPI0020076109|nr:uncharacterized protein F4812DRAFT_451784 [Daldinia caldariorum]KAI1466923.1 hypothetical protein F4812DRAFT_451784 [Daldinia caldariorum]